MSLIGTAVSLGYTVEVLKKVRKLENEKDKHKKLGVKK